MIIAIDFDGTVVEHEYPDIGAQVPHARRVIKRLAERNHKLILYTMRSGDELNDAVRYMKTVIEVDLYGVNANPQQSEWTDSPKAYAEVYIDDAALGCPLIYPINKRPFVDWLKVEEQLIYRNIL